MNTITAFMMGEMNRGKETMVFDWDKAAQLIRENNAIEASAGLRGDWEWTGGKILKDGQPVKDDYTYLSSTWAVPELVMDDGEPIPCYKMEGETLWDAKTKWPESALRILKGEADHDKA